MPEYTFFCNKCKKKYSVFCSIRDYTEKSPCSNCHSFIYSHRLYIEDVATQNLSVKKSDSELKTIGDLAQRNTERMSEDHKHYLQQKHNDYKINKEDTPLPKNMYRPTKTKKTKWT